MKVYNLLKKASFYFLVILISLTIILFFLSKNIIKTIDFSRTKLTPKLEVKELTWLNTDGRFIVDEDGKKIILRGVNLASVDWGYEDWHSQAIKYLAKNWNINVIRIRVIQEDFEKNQEKFFQRLEEEFLIPARENGIYVIIHPRVRNSQTDLPDKGTMAMWKTIAQRYKDDPTVLYDLLAEPHNTNKQTTINAYHLLIKEVRAVHPRSLIFVTGLDWGREINSYLNKPMPYPNIVYRSNPYNKSQDFEKLFGKIAKVYPVFLGEFGAEGFPPMSKDDVKTLIEYAHQLQIGWTAWNFHSIGCPCLLSDYKTFKTSDYGEIVKKALQNNL